MIADRIRQGVKASRRETFDLLRSLVEVNSYSGNAQGVNRVGELVLEKLPGSLDCSFRTGDNGVRHHILTGPCPGDRRILLLGHLDTVFPPDAPPFPFRVAGSRVHGPGTADMKGGVVVMVQALRLLDGLELLHRIPVTAFLNGDEEVGSPFSGGVISEMAGGVSACLVFECGGLGGEVVTTRRGVARFTLTVTGRARHAGVKEGPKASAIEEMARLILALEGLNDHEKGISLNVGTVAGGRANNIVPDLANAGFEVRFWEAEAEKQVMERIEGIVAGVATPGCAASLQAMHRRPGMVPVPGSDGLLTLLRQAARELGLEVGTQSRGGASDGNFLSEAGVPVVDGLGPVGDLDHSHDEYIEEESLHQRIELTALLLARLAGVGE
ncbi:MAG: M20/M25/M40 family metallo-hydrolase [bacterium]|nr:MAG: M20/M25/M40 family metallo-hydrolase [bacterium]